jgi:hypothetical protein
MAMSEKINLTDCIESLIDSDKTIAKAMKDRAFWLGKALPLVAEYDIEDTLSRTRGIMEQAKIVGRLAIWDEVSKSIVIEYEIRKILKTGLLHSTINKIRSDNMGEWCNGNKNKRPSSEPVEIFTTKSGDIF